MRAILRLTLAALTLSILPVADGASAKDKPKRLFESDDILTLTLKGPIPDLSRKPGAPPVPGTLTVTGASPETLPITLTTRGITRRKKEICAFPPLRVDFPQKPGGDSLFKGQKSLKLVTHCQSGEKYQQDVLLEYSAYHLYRSFTQDSFDVRLARVNYVDEGGSTITTRFGYFIEDINDVARRNGQDRLRGANHIARSQLDPVAAARFAVFQYMISNLDWAMTASPPGVDCCHNSRLLGASGATTGLIPVPYDFDYSGLVNAPYAVPPDGFQISNVRVRRYRGFCEHNDQARAFATDIAGRRTALIGIVDQIPNLDAESRQRVDEYLGQFFDQISTPDKISQVLKTCLN